MSTNHSQSKVVSTDAMRKLVEGSYEHLGVILDGALRRNSDAFGFDKDSLTRIATFENRMVVGSDAGDVFSVNFKSVDGNIVLSDIEKIKVPVVASSNVNESIKEFSFGAVDALLSEDSDSVVSHLLMLAELQERQEMEENRDYPQEAVNAVMAPRVWREIFDSQADEIKSQIEDRLESIQGDALEPKYKPLYESDEIPEERFGDYREGAENDLKVLLDRLVSLHESVESEYFGFRSSLTKDEVEEMDHDVLSQFCVFSEDLIDNIGEARSVVADTIEHENCVMCLGKVYDTFAEALTDYEIAGAFVERMVGALDDSAQT